MKKKGNAPHKSPLTMVTIKYLCSAPRQDCWDEKIDSLLKSLGGDKEKRENALRKTLEGLRERQ